MTNLQKIEAAVDAMQNEQHLESMGCYDADRRCAKARTALLTLIEGVCKDAERANQYKRACEVLFTDDSGDLDYIKWYITNKVLTIEARNALAATDEVQK